MKFFPSRDIVFKTKLTEEQIKGRLMLELSKTKTEETGGFGFTKNSYKRDYRGNKIEFKKQWISYDGYYKTEAGEGALIVSCSLYNDNDITTIKTKITVIPEYISFFLLFFIIVSVVFFANATNSLISIFIAIVIPLFILVIYRSAYVYFRNCYTTQLKELFEAEIVK